MFYLPKLANETSKEANLEPLCIHRKFNIKGKKGKKNKMH